MTKRKMKQQHHQHQQMWGFPDDVTMKILSELPAKSLLRFKCACKSWYSLITDPYFIKLHLNRSTQDDNNLCALIRDSNTHHVYSLHQNHHQPCGTATVHDHQVEALSSQSSSSIELNKVTPQKSSDYRRKSTAYDTILGSCNGLILLGTVYRRVALWNPTTGEFKKLPTFIDPYVLKRRGFFNSYRVKIFGLGYDSNNDDYKVIGIHHRFARNTEELECKVAVYSLRSNRWRSIKTIRGMDKCSYYMFLCINNAAKYLNGAIHWLNGNLKKIVCYECGSEEWNEVEVPDECRTNYDLLDLFVRRGRLCIVRDIVRLDAWSYEIYEMREYGVKESWCKISSISSTTLAVDNWVPSQIWELSLLGVMKNGNFLLLGNTDSRQLISYNPMNDSVAELHINDTNVRKKKNNNYNKKQQQLIMPQLLFFETYMSSLVQLKSSQAK